MLWFPTNRTERISSVDEPPSEIAQSQDVELLFQYTSIPSRPPPVLTEQQFGYEIEPWNHPPTIISPFAFTSIDLMTFELLFADGVPSNAALMLL